MNQPITYTFPALLNNSFRNYADRNAMGFVNEPMMTYAEVEQKIKNVSSMLSAMGIRKGDKVAILSANVPNWGIAYFAINFMGAIVVPLLPDFHKNEIENILNHSEARILFYSKALYKSIVPLNTNAIEQYIDIENFSTENSSFTPNSEFAYTYEVQEDDLAAIIYTSGTTGNSKGVMLTHKNIAHNACMSRILQPIVPEDRFLSILPLSHTFENTLGLVLPLISGSSIYYLKKLPTPAVLLPALKTVKPTIMLAVPMIIEKIYRNKILPQFKNSAVLRFLYGLKPTHKILNRMAGKKLMDTFGGHLHFFGIGGAKLDETVEQFLIEAKFPYAIGYGLTETAPVLAGTMPGRTVLGSTGPAIPEVQIKIVDADPKTGEGEIWAKGPNVMKGYYKEPEITAQVLTEDGWFNTGDLGIFDKNNNLYIKGRSKNMIVGASGENIYPEEIEAIINNFEFVSESLVMNHKDKLVAMVHFNREALEEKYKNLKEEVSSFVDSKIEELKPQLHEYVNARVNKFSRLKTIIINREPFKKTATQKIKRYLYK